MIPGWCRILVVAAVMLVASPCAFAQIPASELPGRERERFQQPTPALAQPGGPPIALPSTVAPQGADKIMVVLRGVRTVGGTVYSPEDLAPLYRDIVGRRITVTAIYDIAPASPPNTATTAMCSRARSCRRRNSPRAAPSSASRSSRAISTGSNGRRRCRSIAISSRTTPRRSPPSARSTSGRSSAICCWPAICPASKFKNSLKASETKQGAATLVVEVVEKPVDMFARVDNRGTKARGPLQYFKQRHRQQPLPHARSLDAQLCRRVPDSSELQYSTLSYRQVLTSEGLTLFVNDSYSRGRPGTRDPAAPRIQDAQRSVRRRRAAIRSSASASAT